MTRRPTAALAAACTLALTIFPTAFSGAAPQSSSATITITDSEASQVGDGPDLSTATPSVPKTSVRHFHRRTSHVRRPVRTAKARPLPSRGEDGYSTANVVGRLAVVLNDNTPIRAGRERYGRVLSLAPKGQSLAISGETATDYAVLMIDRTVGYVSKQDVQLLNYQVVSDAPASDLGRQMVQTAEGYLGVPYLWGGDTRAGIDCSGFVRAVYSASGIDLPRVSRDQAAVGYDVPHDVAAGDWQQWAPGDRMYFACHHPYIDHTGMYIGNGLFIHASVGHSNQVAIDRVDNAYYSVHLVAVRRSAELLHEQPMPGDATAQASAPPADTPSLDPEANQQ